MNRTQFIESDICDITLHHTDVVVSAHACGGLTDLILERAVKAGARVAVLPCCHNLKSGDMGGLEGWMDGPLAMDSARASRLRFQEYKVYTQIIPSDITSKNRVLMAEPDSNRKS